MNFNLIPIEREGQRVLTTAQLAEFYETDSKVISNNFNRNKERYVEGKHYYCLTGDDLKEFKTNHQFDEQFKHSPSVYLWTERGSLLHAKSLGTEKAWDVHDQLVETYFRARETPQLTDAELMATAVLKAQALLETKNKEITQLTEKIETDKPKVLFADAVETAQTSILIGDLAKIIKQNGVDIGQKRLFEHLRTNGYLIKSGNSKNMPTQKAMDMKLFEVKERTINNPDGTIRITKTPKVTGKGQTYFVNQFLAKDPTAPPDSSAEK